MVVRAEVPRMQRARVPHPRLDRAYSSLAQSNSRLSPVSELQTSGFEHLPKTIDGALAKSLAPFKPDDGIRRYFRGCRQFPDAQADRGPCHSALYREHLFTTLPCWVFEQCGAATQ